MVEVLKERVEVLKANFAGLPESKVGFASSLIQQFDKKGKLSEKQAEWVDRLADLAQGIPDFTAPQPEQVGSLASLITMFSNAAVKLKYPAIVLQTPSGEEVRLSRAGTESKNPGCIYVKAPSSIGYAGKVDPEGNFFPIRAVEPNLKSELAYLLRELARHPAETAAKHGKLTGKCCFCNTSLTDEKSTAVGYGPTCAKHYHLPWGKAA